jgi:N6-L-threonylcarbamoyladenine synthase
MKVLAIETSCDETAVAIIDGKQILANKIYSQIDLHREYGGVVPEIAARSHVESLPGLLEESFTQAQIAPAQLDAVAATGGPGLIGGVMIGVMYAKTIAAALKKDFIAINHLEGHALSPFLAEKPIVFPYLLLLASGGHCQIVVVSALGSYNILGVTIDDAAGEAFDKVAKMLGLGYPGGPAVEEMALQGDKDKFKFPKPMLNKGGCDFSFSGLKTAVRNVVAKQEFIDDEVKADICASFQDTVADIFLHKLAKATEVFKGMYPEGKDIVIAGGVAANNYIRGKLVGKFAKIGYNVSAPPLALCTDNAVMIAYAAYQRLLQGDKSDLSFAPLSRWPLDKIKY